MPRALCIVAGYISLMRRLTGLEEREERRSGVLSADVSRETPSGMSSTKVFSLCRRGGVSTIGVASSAGASVSGYANVRRRGHLCTFISTAPWRDLGVLRASFLFAFSPSTFAVFAPRKSYTCARMMACVRSCVPACVC